MAAGTGERVQRVVVAYPREGSDVRAATAYRTALALADSVDLSAPIGGAVPLGVCSGRQTLYVRGRFTAAGQTARVAVVFYGQAGTVTGSFVGHFEATLIASPTEVDGPGLPTAQPIPFDALGKNYEVRLITPPAVGTLDIFAWEG